MPIIDFHNHYYPPAYLDALRSGSNVTVGVDAEGNPLLYYPGDYNILVPGHATSSTASRCSTSWAWTGRW